MGVELDVFIGPKENQIHERSSFVALLKDIIDNGWVLKKAAVLSGDVGYQYPMGDINIIRNLFTEGMEGIEEDHQYFYEEDGDPLPKNLNEFFYNDNELVNVEAATEEINDIFSVINTIDGGKNIAVCLQGLDHNNLSVKKYFDEGYGNPDIVVYFFPKQQAVKFTAEFYEGDDLPHEKQWNLFIAFQGARIITPEIILESDLGATLSNVLGELHSGINYS